jgi:predicted permease
MSEPRHALSRLGRTPLFTLTASLTLSLAIGANTAVFALIDRVVLRPLPYPQSDRLLELDHGSRVLNLSSGVGMTSGLYYQYQRARTLESLAIYQQSESTLVTDGAPAQIQIAHATASLADVLRVPPQVGRWFADSETAPGGPALVVLSHGLWVRRFGADPRITERSVVLDGVPTHVIGVMPASFAFPHSQIEAWVPARISRAMGFAVPFTYDGVARLRSGVSVDTARTELNALIADLPNVYPGDPAMQGNVDGVLRSAARPLKDMFIGSAARGLWVLLAAMALLFAVACANIANLVLVRASSRQREVAVRRALGASVTSIAGLFLSESVVLAAIGTAGGVAIAGAALRLLVVTRPATLPRLHEVALDPIVIAFAAGIGLTAGLVLGSIPALWGLTATSGLRGPERGHTASGRERTTRHLLMAGQVAMALALLVGAGLMARSYVRLRAIDPGFYPSSALTFRVGLPEGDYPTRAAAAVAHRAILERIAREPGVDAVSASTGLPLADACFGNSLLVRGQRLGADPVAKVGRMCAVSEGFVSAMRMRLVQGRDLERADVDRGRTNVLVNEAFVRTVLDGADPLGRQFRSNAPPPPGVALADAATDWNGAPPWLTIVGVVSNTPFLSLTESTPVAYVYMPMSIAGGPDIPDTALLGPSNGAMTYVVRARVSPATLTPAVERAVQSVDRSLAVAQVRTLQDIVDGASAQMAFTVALLVIAGIVALGIGVVGIYGVVAYAVSQRRREIGLRLALGATPGGVVAMIVRQGTIVALAGAAAGLVAALGMSRVLASLLFGVSPRDPVVFMTVGAILAIVAVVSCWLPARAAASVSPAEALSAE